MGEQRGSLRVTGTIIEPLPSAMFAVELESGQRVLAHLGEALRLPITRLLPVPLFPRRISRPFSKRNSS